MECRGDALDDLDAAEIEGRGFHQAERIRLCAGEGQAGRKNPGVTAREAAKL